MHVNTREWGYLFCEDTYYQRDEGSGASIACLCQDGEFFADAALVARLASR